MQFHIATHLVALATLVSQSVGELTIAPRFTESKVGDTTYFNCSTDLESEEIFWFHGDKYIYTGKGILDPYNKRFEIDRNASIGSHNLVIHSVEPRDAGEYICVDAEGVGTKGSAELVVLDNYPDCQSNIHPEGVIGQNIFNIPLDDVQLTCAASYHGSVPPQMEWKKVGDNSSIYTSVSSNITSNNRIIYTLKLKGDSALDESSYICQTKWSTPNQYKCASEIIKVLYFVDGNTTEINVARGEKVTCIANNSTFPCINQWYHDNYTCPLSCDETITTHFLGEYLCTVKCQARRKDYYFEAMKVIVFEPITSPLPSTSGIFKTAAVIPIVIIIIIAALSITVLAIRNRRLQRKYEYGLWEDESYNDYLEEISLPITHESERINELHVIGRNQQFLVENIKSPGLIAILHENNCITDDDRDRLLNQPTSHSMNDALLQWMRTIQFNEDNTGLLILECVRKAEQNFLSELFGKGGVLVKSIISTKLASIDLFRKSCSKSSKKLKETEAIAIGLLNDTHGFSLYSMRDASWELPYDDIVIAPYCKQVDNGIVIWFWCKSNAGLRNLQRMYKWGILLRKLATIFKQIFSEISSRWLVVPTNVNIFVGDFENRVAEDNIELLHKIKGEANPKEKNIRGVAILDGKLYVLHENSSKLKVYNCRSNDFHNAKVLKVKELVNTSDMCSCKRNNFLYIMDMKSVNNPTPREVLKISTTGNVVGNWFTQSNSEGNLSATTEGHVIMTVLDKQMLLEYSSTGELERVINLPNCPSPDHAIKLGDRYIVCHSDRAKPMHRLCLVDNEGNVDKSFGHGLGSAGNQLYNPSYMAAGSSGSVIVADRFNNRVLVLDSNLEFKTKLVPKYKQRFNRPRAVCLWETLLVVLVEEGVPYETTFEEASESTTEAIDGANPTKRGDFLIEKTCRILVFDIDLQALLEK